MIKHTKKRCTHGVVVYLLDRLLLLELLGDEEGHEQVLRREVVHGADRLYTFDSRSLGRHVTRWFKSLSYKISHLHELEVSTRVAALLLQGAAPVCRVTHMGGQSSNTCTHTHIYV